MPFWLALFLANALITGLLGWYFVPWASRALDWWLNPKPATTPRVIWAGVAHCGAIRPVPAGISGNFRHSHALSDESRSEQGLSALCGGTKINSSEPPLTAVCATYATHHSCSSFTQYSSSPAAVSRNLQGRREARAVLRSIGVRANVRSVSEESNTNGRTNW
jgi:hypothetical protein